jgi:hypothetical protein
MSREVPVMSATPRLSILPAVLLLLMTAGGSAGAQGAPPAGAGGRLEGEGRPQDDVPKEHLPPPGMCRLWVAGVPASQQPAPTDCATAVRNRPGNARVLYGQPVKGKSGAPLPVKGFAPTPRKGAPLIPPDPAPPDPRGREAWEAKRISDQQLHGDPPASSTPASSYPGGAVSPPGPPGSYGGATGGYVTPGGAVVPAPVGDPRYFNQGPGVRPPGFGSSVCLDRDEDGWCDDQRFGPPTCVDRDKDGRCDDLPGFAAQAYPQVLPSMRAAQDVLQGRPSTEVMQWLGTNEFILRIPDQGRGGVPWRAIFLDQQAALLQVWTDVNRDGRADRVEIFRNGERVKLIQR